jgi:hypothetical protein
MGLIKEVSLSMRAAKRLGAFSRAHEQGMLSEQARKYSENLYPPTPDDTAYEDKLRRGGGLPWVSALSLLYPFGAMIYAASISAPVFIVIGYGFANLGYLLFAAGIIAGHFRVLHLSRRWQVLLCAVIAFVTGTVLSNVD